ncbi:multidrug ABC transporter ATP-binding protein [Salinivibrio sp. ML198]|uniref:ABC transporter ATP-binding protein n=1 Tax=unclassified Salinivibrio TaxID=2636825 RepID=UPI000986DC70|nr:MULTISPECIES: ABC transporter ATP-binding protein [unclassified Salinivibrio]OOE68964.1 multidrug ABC transporter ATP-binding protein [Salinivibrio sp. IB868]OOE77829.1 multidrug ABC transporter ATP-binding protein [Salinivibrio sp. IB870]OOE79283.1 multidrug ABC transporter ATP-binding protein [Salinivibrio sp. ML198]
MYNRLKTLFNLLTADQRKRLVRLQILVVLMAFAELTSVVAIGPFMALVGDIGQLQGDGKLAHLYQYSGLASPTDFIFWVGVAVLVSLTIAAIISMYTSWRLSLYAQQVGAELSVRLYRYYMSQSWLFHAGGSSSQLTNKVAQETNRITQTIIQPTMQLVAKAVLAIVMASAVFVYNPSVALAGLAVFTIAYIILYRTVRKKLSQNGINITSANRQRFTLMNEGFGGIKDTLLLGRQTDFNQRYQSASEKFGHAQGVTKGLSQAPRYAMELIAFGSVIFLVLYLVKTYDGNPGQILPILSVYALAGFKLLPAFQQIYTGVAQIRGNLSAFDNLEQDLIASQYAAETSSTRDKLKPTHHVQLNNVTFQYPSKEDPALQGLSLELPVNQVIGLVGASGSGKSTAIDILLGLIEPSQGSLKVDGKPITAENVRAWQNNIGFVPQSIFLSDATIRENIAFGLPVDEIDEQKVRKAAKMAHLEELLEQLPNGLDTRVGERGVQLSGGQRQRIGIARALYDDADVLVLDEATSALDGITEKLVMDAIHDFAGNKTIIMIAHRLSTVQQCDCIYMLEQGKVIDHGTYAELYEKNAIFKNMAAHS